MRKHEFFIIFALFISTMTPAFAYKIKTFQPLQIQPLNIHAEEPTLTENYPKITQLETYMFKRTYERENIYKRLSRLEYKIFNTEFPNMPLASRVENILTNVDSGIMFNISEKELAKIEFKTFGRNFPNDDTESRITRLEKEILGAMQGGNLRERFDTIKTASKHYNTYPEIIQTQNAYQAYHNNHAWDNIKPRGLGGFFQNIINTLSNSFSCGTMTGYTPPIYDPYNPYAQTTPYNPMNQYPSFMNPATRQEEYFMSNRRGYLNNRNIGSQSSVRILD